jgi:hypothetical protein
MADETVVATSTTEEAANSLDSFTEQERSNWLMKGTPMPKDEAEPAPASEASEPPKAEPIAPATDTGKTQEPKPGRAEQRKAELGSEIQELLRKRAELRAEIDAAAGGRKPAEKPAESAPATQKTDGEPVPPDPSTWTGTWEQLEAAKIKYVRDLTKWELGKGERDRAASAQRTRITELQGAYRTRADAVLEADPEYADAQAVIGEFVTAKGVSELILESEVGPEIVMHLYRLPNAEQKRVAALSPLALAREIARLEMQLSKAPAPAPEAAPQPKRTSAASKPATELSGKNAASTVDEAEQALAEGDFERYSRVMNARAVRKT